LKILIAEVTVKINREEINNAALTVIHHISWVVFGFEDNLLEQTADLEMQYGGLLRIH